jgi:hypothetical protein
MPGFMPGIHVFLFNKQGVDGRDKRAFTPVFDGLCPAMTAFGSQNAAATRPTSASTASRWPLALLPP